MTEIDMAKQVERVIMHARSQGERAPIPIFGNPIYARTVRLMVELVIASKFGMVSYHIISYHIFFVYLTLSKRKVIQ